MGNETFDQALGNTLRAVRERAGLTQDEAAHALGRRQATVSRWENGTQGLSALDVACAATTYHTTPEHLYTRALQDAPTVVEDDMTQRARALEAKINQRRHR